MIRIAAAVAMSFWAACPLPAFEPPEQILDRFLAQVKAHLDLLPDYVCDQEVSRFMRSRPELPWQPVDTLRLEVAMVGGRELYSRAGAREFAERPLAELVGKGTITTGQIGLFTRHVFLAPNTRFAYRHLTEHNSRPAHEFTYDVAPEHSRYRLRAGNEEATVGFQGSFLIDAETLHILKLEVQAYDIPERLGLAEVDTALVFGSVPAVAGEVVLPVAATQAIVAADGIESLNRARITGCRHYEAESTVRFDDPSPVPSSPAAIPPSPAALSSGALLELAFEVPWNPATATIDAPVRLRLLRLQSQPASGAALARVVRLDYQERPFPIWEIGFELESLLLEGQTIPVNATMEDAGPAAGLLRQEKRMDPIFTRQRQARMNILVREVQRGQGILLWDARRGPLPRSLKMRWRLH
jgi:hypothetical protein